MQFIVDSEINNTGLKLGIFILSQSLSNDGRWNKNSSIRIDSWLTYWLWLNVQSFKLLLFVAILQLSLHVLKAAKTNFMIVVMTSLVFFLSHCNAFLLLKVVNFLGTFAHCVRALRIGLDVAVLLLYPLNLASCVFLMVIATDVVVGCRCSTCWPTIPVLLRMFWASLAVSELW